MKKSRKICLYKKIFPLLMIVASLTMCVGYATVTGVDLNISGSVDAELYEGVFITDVVYYENFNADTINSEINYYVGTVLDSSVVLGDDINSSISYKVTLYNNSNKDYMYIDVITDLIDKSLYSNEDITFNFDVLESYNTILMPGDEITFTLTFSYSESADLTNNILNSKINFRFKEVPKYTLSNSSNTYVLSDIYPDCVPKEYSFTVSNSDDTGINNVPMKYSFVSSIDKPLSVKIYDESGNEVINGISLGGDGVTEEIHTYTIKIYWDSSNPENDILYDTYEYAGLSFDCVVDLIFTPYDEEYNDYTINDDFDFDITSATFNFDINANSDIKIEKTASDLNVVINNYSSDSDYNVYDVDYDIVLEGNSKFTPSISGITMIDGVFPKTLTGGSKLSDSYTIKLAADIDDVNLTETATLIITINEPYKKIISIPLTLSLQKVIVTLNANGGSVGTTSYTVYKGRNYPILTTPTWTGHTFNGWYTASNGGTKVTSSTEITNGSDHTLYANWTSRLLVDHVSLGDYVNYPVSYNNVPTKADGTLTASSTYSGWRVVGFGGSGNNRYVKLISAGIPLSYMHPVATSGTADNSELALTDNFLSTPINSTVTSYNFIKSGFLTASGGSTTSISQVKTLFNNKYTQTFSNGNPAVRSVIEEDVENALGTAIENLTDLRNSWLFGITAETASGSFSYAGYYIATPHDDTYLWATYYSGYVVYTSGTNGVRPVVLLKPTVEANGQDANDVWQIKI